MISLQLDGSRADFYRGRQFTQATATASAVGLADMVLRTKYTLYADHGSGVAAAVDVRLPTGKEENLLGTGTASIKFTGIGSVESGNAALHLNGGFTLGGLAREFSYGGAVAVDARAGRRRNDPARSRYLVPQHRLGGAGGEMERHADVDSGGERHRAGDDGGADNEVHAVCRRRLFLRPMTAPVTVRRARFRSSSPDRSSSA